MADTTREPATKAAAKAARAYQANPTPDTFAVMIAAEDTATDLGATKTDMVTAFTTPTPDENGHPMPKQNPLAPPAFDDFRVSVNGLWASWTGGRLTDQQAFPAIREALTELEEDKPAADPRFDTFHTTVASATAGWEAGHLPEEDAMVQILDALLALDAAAEVAVSQ